LVTDTAFGAFHLPGKTSRTLQKEYPYSRLATLSHRQAEIQQVQVRQDGGSGDWTDQVSKVVESCVVILFVRVFRHGVRGLDGTALESRSPIDSPVDFEPRQRFLKLLGSAVGYLCGPKVQLL
jgi:hypothetical protein